MSSPEIIPITRFIDYLRQNPEYRDCDVISVTHSKNMDSIVLHEYLHVIIRRPSGDWRRLLVERQKEQDQVIIGFWPWVPKEPRAPKDIGLRTGSSGSGDSGGSGSHKSEPPLPLLMRNLRFPSLDLPLVARILLTVHEQKPKYNLLLANCYWYANAVFKTVRGVDKNGVYFPWPYLKYQCLPFIWKKKTRDALREAAKKFEDDTLPTEPVRGDLGLAESLHSEAGTPADSSHISIKEEVKMSQRIIKAMQTFDLSSDLDEPAIRELVKERKQDIVAFSDEILARPDSDTNLAYFEGRMRGSEEVQIDQDSDTEDDSAFFAKLVDTVTKISAENAASEEEEARYEKALCVFAGGVLRAVFAGN